MGRKEVCQNSWSHHTVDKGQITLKAKTCQETQKRNYKSSWSRRLNQKSFALTVHQNLAKRVVLFPGIIVRQHFTVQKQMGLLRERYAGFHGMVLLSAMQDLLSDGKNTLRTAIRRTIQRTNNSVWFDGRISPYFCRRHVATASVRQESLTRNINRLCITCGRIWKGDILVADIEEWSRWTHLNSTPEGSMQRKW